MRQPPQGQLDEVACPQNAHTQQIDMECPVKKGVLTIKKEVDIPKQVVCSPSPVPL
jgi:hypothetical protein